MRTWRIAFLSALVPAMVAGCAPPAAQATPPRGEPAGTSASAQHTASGPRTTPARRDTTLVRLRRQGGLAGVDDRVTVSADGRTRLSHRTGPVSTPRLTAAELRGLRRDLGRLRLGRSQAPPPGADMFTYTLTYRGRHATRSTLPATWRPVVRRLEKLLDRHPTPH